MLSSSKFIRKTCRFGQAFYLASFETISPNNLPLREAANLHTDRMNGNVNIQPKRFSTHQPHTLKTVQDRVMLVLNLYDKIDNTKLNLDADFFKDLGLDSLDFVEIIMEIEDEFRFEIPDGDSDRCYS